MPLKLELELTEEDLGYYRKIMQDTWQRNAQKDEKELAAAARRLLDAERKGDAPAFVKKRLDDLGTLIAMVEDPEWPLEDEYRQRIIAAASYFAEPMDIVPDSIPGLGFLDDAIMAELVIQELEHDLDGYREFCEFREQEEARRGQDAHENRKEWVGEKRRQVMLRIREHQRQRLRHAAPYEATDPILAYLG